MRIGIVGFGVVGSALKRWLARSDENEVAIYDKLRPGYKSELRASRSTNANLFFYACPRRPARTD